MSESEEQSVHLFQNSRLVFLFDRGVAETEDEVEKIIQRVGSKCIHLNRTPSTSNSPFQRGVNAVGQCVKPNESALFMKLLGGQHLFGINLYLDLNARIMKKLHRRLPNCFMVLEGDVQVAYYSQAEYNDRDEEEEEEEPYHAVDRFQFDKRVELKVLVNENSQYNDFLRERFVQIRYPAEDSHRDGLARLTITWNVSVGWKGPVQGPNEMIIKPIKMSMETFFQNLLGNEESKDLTLVAGNKAEVKCHKIIFAAHSPVLAAMVSPETGMQEFKSGVIKTEENSELGLHHLLRYLYGLELKQGEQELDCDLAVELFRTAHKYELKQLEGSLSELMSLKGAKWYSMEALLELYFHVSNLENFEKLHGHLLRIMISRSEDLRECKQLREQVNQVDALDLVWKLFDLK